MVDSCDPAVKASLTGVVTVDAAAPTVFLHHTAWQVDDVDEVGRGPFAMLEGHPERHVWGLGRHDAGSTFFSYLRDPADNCSEYYAELDLIPEGWPPKPTRVTSGSTTGARQHRRSSSAHPTTPISPPLGRAPRLDSGRKHRFAVCGGRRCSGNLNIHNAECSLSSLGHPLG
jgi:hypothetical protein